MPEPSAPASLLAIERAVLRGQERRGKRRIPATLMVLAVMTTTLGIIGASPASAAAAVPTPSAEALKTSRAAGDAQAKLVDAEDARIIAVRQGLSDAPFTADGSLLPFVAESGTAATLVLPPRAVPYTLAELAVTQPASVQKLDGYTYLLQQNLAVSQGATLLVGNPQAMTLRLASGPRGFTSIVGLGGELRFVGTAAAPVAVTSWDTQAGKPDLNLSDGRAYIRAIGGSLSLSHVNAADLGFWSGRTGGMAFTGTNRPDTDPAGNNPLQARAQARAQRAAQHAARDAEKQGVPVPPAATTAPTDTNVSASGGEVADSTLTGNAFGLFVSDADGVRISNTTVSASLSDGLVLHHFVTGAVVQNVTSQGNQGDGFRLSRGVENARLESDSAIGNADAGFSISGRPLSNGPSTAGHSSTVYGNNVLTNGTASDNVNEGIEILSGKQETVSDMRVAGNGLGIVVRLNATGTVLSGNRVSNSRKDGITLRDGATAVVTENTIEHVRNGVVVRDAHGTIRDNTISRATQHGVVLSGSVKGSTVTGNTLSGRGGTAIDTSKADNATLIPVQDNKLLAWTVIRHQPSWLRQLLHPMNIAWAALLLLSLGFTYRTRRRLRRAEAGIDPYAATRPLSPAAAVPAQRTAPQEETRGYATAGAGEADATGPGETRPDEA